MQRPELRGSLEERHSQASVAERRAQIRGGQVREQRQSVSRQGLWAMRNLEFTPMWREASEWLRVGDYHELIYV